jgi:hypothetical protein
MQRRQEREGGEGGGGGREEARKMDRPLKDREEMVAAQGCEEARGHMTL